MIEVDGREFGSLRDVHDWARRTLPEHVHVVASGVITGPGTSWTHPVPLTILGGAWDGTGTVGQHWLSHRAPTPLTVTGVMVQDWQRGGIDAGPHGDVTVYGSVFQRIGGGPAYAAIYAADHCEVTVERSTFAHLEQDPDGALLHAVYLHDSSTGRVVDCRFVHISGDPIRARHGSRVDVLRCKASRSGVQALASTWQRADELPSTVSTRDCHAGRVHNGSRPSLIAYRLRRTA